MTLVTPPSRKAFTVSREEKVAQLSGSLTLLAPSRWIPVRVTLRVSAHLRPPSAELMDDPYEASIVDE